MAEQQLETILRQGLEEQGLPADGETLRRFRVYYQNLEQANQVMNLTAITGEEDAARLHFLDCAALAAAVDLREKSLLDVGTGAGFPGLVLKILCPELKLTLLDSLDKRLDFLRDTCQKLGFKDLSISEILERELEVRPQGTRPKTRMVGHTGYMVFARKL